MTITAEIVSVARAMRDYIDALPADVVAALPAMPGFERDWADNVIENASQELQPIEWGSPKTVGQLIGQLQALDPSMETTAMQRMPADILDGNAVRRVPITISFEKLDGQWLAPYKGDGRKVLAFWAKADHREEEERGEPFTAPPVKAGHNKPRIAPHDYRECVNALKEVAIAYHGTDQLRERLNTALNQFVIPDHPNTRDAPPAPAMPVELLEAMDEVIRISDRDHEAWSRAKAAIAAYRAAMLAQPVSQRYKLNSPEIPDGWIKCNARTPEIRKREADVAVIVVTEGEQYGCEALYFRDGKFRWGRGEDPIEDVTHWMPLPAAPEGGN